MRTSEKSVDAARSDALQWQAQARGRIGDPPTQDELDRERLDGLGSPGASVAAAVLSTTGWQTLALDDDLRPSSGPLATYGEVYHHFRQRHVDGVGIELGAKPGSVVVAVRGTASAWSEWLRVHAAVTVDRRFVDGLSSPSTGYRDPGYFSRVSWQPPAGSVRRGGVAVGQSQLNLAAEAMRGSRIGRAELGWLVWAVPQLPGQVLSFRNRKIGDGLDVVASGVLPLHATRQDGWTLRVSLLPRVEQMPRWLVDKFGGCWGKPAA